jgi:hypothetical protein
VQCAGLDINTIIHPDDAGPTRAEAASVLGHRLINRIQILADASLTRAR